MNLNAAKSRHTAIFLLALLLLADGGSAVADQQTDQLKAENLRLKAQVQALQQSCVVTPPAPQTSPSASVVPPATVVLEQPASTAGGVASSVIASPTTPVSAAPPAPVAPIPQAAKAPETVQAVPQTPAPATAAAVAEIPKGYKLVPINTPVPVDPLTPPYDRTGCSRDVFKGPPPAKWNDISNWSGLRNGLDPAQVEEILGKEHYNASGHGRVEWQYGRCGDQIAGRVQFLEGKVVYWQVPDL